MIINVKLWQMSPWGCLQITLFILLIPKIYFQFTLKKHTNIFSRTVLLQYSFEVIVLYLSIAILCYFYSYSTTFQKEIFYFYSTTFLLQL